MLALRSLLYTAAAMTDEDLRGDSESRKDDAPAADARTNAKASGLAVWSWVLYDFANTIFSISILSYFFPLWLGDELGAGAGLVNYVAAGAADRQDLTGPGIDFLQKPYALDELGRRVAALLE